MRLFTDVTTAEFFLTVLMVPGAVVWLMLRGQAGRAAACLGMLCTALTLQAQEGGKKASKNPVLKAGLAAGNAKEKPQTRYSMQVIALVEEKWRLYLEQADVPPGLVEISFYVNARGGVENVRVINESPAPQALTDLALRAVRDADIPPIPADVLPTLPAEDGGRMKITYGARLKPGASALAQMMEEADKELARADKKGLPQETPPAPPPPKALPVPDDAPGLQRPSSLFQPFNRGTPTQGGLPNRGKNTAEMEKTPLGRYTKLVTGQVEKKWRLYVQLRSGLWETKGYLETVFYVNKKGVVEGLKVLNDKDSSPQLTALTLRAIKDAEITPIPADVITLLPKEEPERLKIEYNVLIY